MPKKEYWKLANKELDYFYDRLNGYEVKEWRTLTKGWIGVQKKLNGLIEKLSKEKFLSEDKLFRSELYKDFLKVSAEQIKKYSIFSQEVITQGQLFYAESGIELAQNTIGLVKVNFNRINVKAVNHMIGVTQDGERLYNLLYKSYPDTVNKITNRLINNVALGQSPEITARQIGGFMNGNYTRSLTIARTEQMQVYRRSSIEQYKDAKVGITQYERIEQPDCCDECDLVNGKLFDLDVTFETHPRCRGGTLPVMD